MKSYTQGRNLAGTWTKNTATANLMYLDQVANDAYRHLCAMKDWPFLERLRTLTTAASTQFYNLPYDTDMVREISVTVGTTTYTPKPSPSRQHWDMLNLTAFTSDIPEWWFVFAGQVGLWPKPATAGSTINVTQKSRVIDLGAADYTTGTITTVATAAGVTTVTGSGTAWGSGMVGRFIRIDSTVAALGGDSQWYEIASVTSTTALTLTRVYGGTAIAAGSATYTIGQMPLLPESFHDTPWSWAAFKYWSKESDKRKDDFKNSYDADVISLVRTWSAPTTDLVIDGGDDDEIINPNLVIKL